MTFEIIKGDLFDPTHNFDGLAQGVNTFGVMGAGIAVPFREKWPAMYEDYKALCEKWGPTLGGLIHIWSEDPLVEEVETTWDDGDVLVLDTGTTIYNLFSQTKPGADGDYELLKKATILMKQHAEETAYKVGLPWIGCGIAGLERHNVQDIFSKVLGDSDVEFVLVEQ